MNIACKHFKSTDKLFKSFIVGSLTTVIGKNNSIRSRKKMSSQNSTSFFFSYMDVLNSLLWSTIFKSSSTTTNTNMSKTYFMQNTYSLLNRCSTFVTFIFLFSLRNLEFEVAMCCCCCCFYREKRQSLHLQKNWKSTLNFTMWNISVGSNEKCGCLVFGFSFETYWCILIKEICFQFSYFCFCFFSMIPKFSVLVTANTEHTRAADDYMFYRLRVWEKVN